MPTSFAPFFLAMSILSGVCIIFTFISFLMTLLDDDREDTVKARSRLLATTLILVVVSALSFFFSIGG